MPPGLRVPFRLGMRYLPWMPHTMRRCSLPAANGVVNKERCLTRKHRFLQKSTPAAAPQNCVSARKQCFSAVHTAPMRKGSLSAEFTAFHTAASFASQQEALQEKSANYRANAVFHQNSSAVKTYVAPQNSVPAPNTAPMWKYNFLSSIPALYEELLFSLPSIFPLSSGEAKSLCSRTIFPPC